MNNVTNNSVLTKHQKKTKNYTRLKHDDYGLIDLYVSLRFDDKCGNGHNTFSLTGSIVEAGKPKNDRYTIVGGAIGDEIAELVPELAHLNRWHLTSSDGPIHYVANTLYHARTCSHKDKQPGDPVKFESFLKFDDFPITFSQKEKGWFDWLLFVQENKLLDKLEVLEVKHPEKPELYSPNYTFQVNKDTVGLGTELLISPFYSQKYSKQLHEWYRVPFADKKQADEFLTAVKTYNFAIVKVATEWATAVKPNITAARECAVWPEATLEQLQDEQLLTDRLPALMAKFKHDIEQLGFVY